MMVLKKLLRSNLLPIELCAQSDMGNFSMCKEELILLEDREYRYNWEYDEE